MRIADGDTLTILEAGHRQRRTRLADIDAPEKAQPFGTRSRQSLAKLCAGKVATVADRGLDRYGRTIGVVTCAGIDANAEQVRRGMAWVYRHYAPEHSPLYALEADARLAKPGLWVDPKPVPPWVLRRERRRCPPGITYARPMTGPLKYCYHGQHMQPAATFKARPGGRRHMVCAKCYKLILAERRKRR